MTRSLHHTTLALCAVVAAMVLMVSTAHALAPFAYSINTGTGDLGSDNFFSPDSNQVVVPGLLGTDPRTGNQVSVSFDVPSTPEGRIMAIATLEKFDPVQNETSYNVIPVRGAVRWTSTSTASTNAVTSLNIGTVVSGTGQAVIRGCGGGSAINLRIRSEFDVNTVDEISISSGEAVGVLRYDRTAVVRYQGLVVGWFPEVGVAQWSYGQMTSLTPPGTPPRAFQGVSLIFTGINLFASDVATNIRLQVFPEAADRPGIMRVNMVSPSTRVRISAQHDYLATREWISLPGFDWSVVESPEGNFRATSRVGRTEGRVIRWYPDVL